MPTSHEDLHLFDLNQVLWPWEIVAVFYLTGAFLSSLVKKKEHTCFVMGMETMFLLAEMDQCTLLVDHGDGPEIWFKPCNCDGPATCR
jgi:UDP-2,3-diacylglucosamine pyrophosphatase LpxH